MKPQMTNQRQITIPSDEQMYAAVSAWVASFDGRFYFGVVSTGVFCRPCCAAGLGRRENVRFFADPEAAVNIEDHADDKLTLSALSKRANLSASRFQKTFKAAFGVSPREYQDAARLDLLKGALKEGDDVTGAIFSAGFGSTSRVYGEATRSMGMTPSAYRAGGEGEKICYACRESALGPLLMAATDRGVCFAQFGDSRNELLEQLAAEFPRAEIARSSQQEGEALDAWIDALDKHLGESAPRPDLPLDLRGTSFQLKVWRHRVLRGNGDLGGYRWGVERKRTLLDMERRNRQDTR
jgi:AraC family transcriptional regulator of adaptative response/methylated-DNA-[protein]-cysteine methyltransferase